MADGHKILVVDDDELMRTIVGEAIGDCYHVIGVGSGEACLEAAGAERPDLVLLDVEMPGMDGYETCRRLKNDFELAVIPVIFISAHDQIEARLRGYEAGADDYIVKPIDLRELQAKVAGLLGRISEKAQLKEMASYASRTAMTAMSSMSEVGSLLQILQAFNSCTDYQVLAQTTLRGLADYGLEGAVQVRTPDGPLTLASRGEASPLESSVIGHMTGMDRIVQYRNRLSITYPRVSMLVSNMPTEDAERCGRLRDHLAVLIESAEVRANTLIAEAQTYRRNERVAAAVQRITAALGEIDQEQRHTRVATGMAIQDLTTRLERAYVSLALTETQEEYIAAICSEGIAKVLEAQMAESSQQDRMTAIVRELENMLTL
ncbi:MAG: response regulator [Rhodocyclaceae bacterium]|nr:response regulator [Rhodocyclaceae bacterium]